MKGTISGIVPLVVLDAKIRVLRRVFLPQHHSAARGHSESWSTLRVPLNILIGLMRQDACLNAL